MRILYLLFFFLLVTTNILAEQDTIPEASWENRAAYKASEKLVVQYMKDIEQNPVSDLERREKSDYIIRWILGCPYVALKLRNRYFEKILTDEDYHFADYTAYTLLFGEVLYYLENPFDRNKTNALRNGIYYSMEVYKKLKIYDNSTTCETYELFIRLDENKTLNKFIVLDDSK